MSEHLIKPYEISVWEDQLTQNGFIENKLAVIGSDTMTGLNKVYDPVFNKKANGERTLTFSLKYRYFDSYSGEEVINPFVNLLVNERKIKLYYDNKWYEFIIKDHTESSDELTWTYTCTDAFVLELSKIGYNITFDSELNNNQGTARELAKQTIKETDWRVGDTNIGRQMIVEPLYKGVTATSVTVYNTDTKQNEIVDANTPVYVFYSYIKNKDGNFLQFIKRNGAQSIDDNNVITATNYRFLQRNLVITDTEIKFEDTTLITLGDIETEYSGNRLVYNQLTTYDSVMGRTVNRFAADDREIYGYTDYTYTTSNVIINYITNGENFNVLEDGTLQGWNPYVDFEKEYDTDKVNKLELITKPELSTGKELIDLAALSQIEGFLKVRFKGALTEDYKNAIFNSGIENNASSIKSISKGEKFVFRWRAGKGESVDDLSIADNLGLIVAKYTQDPPNPYTYYYKHIDPDNIILQFEGTPTVLNNLIEGGYIREEVVDDKHIYNYVIDDVVQTVSTKYVYKNSTDNKLYIWDGINSIFEELDDQEYSNYLPYYYLVAEAQKSLPNNIVQDVTEKIGIFVYINDIDTIQTTITKSFEPEAGEEADYPTSVKVNIIPKYNTAIDVSYISDGVTHTYQFTAGTSDNTDSACVYDADKNIIIFTDVLGIQEYTIELTEIKPVYIQDIQLTRFVPDGADATGETPILMGNIPTATSNATEYYYLKPDDGAAAEDVKTYSSLQELANDLSIQVATIEALYNEDSEKYLSITASQSNCFDILQNIAETFECWIDLVVNHDNTGRILYDESGLPQKYVYLKEYAGNNNWVGFKYGINLQSIERTVNSEEFVTKLIVDQSQSDYVDEGYVSISSAPSNTSGESYILNFNYYYNQGLLDRDIAEADKLDFITQLAETNIQLKTKEKEKQDYEASLIALGSRRNVFTELIQTAQDTKTKALGEFENLTGYSYEEYKEEHTTLPDADQLTEEETIVDILGDLYVSSATINNYSGILTNVEQEYWQVRNKLYGSENYNVKVWVDRDANDVRHVFVELNDYLPGFSFTIGDSTYVSTVSKKYFDIETTYTTITFTAPTGYTIDTSEYEINDYETVRFKITSDATIPGIDDEIQELREEKEQLIKTFNNKYHRFIQEGTWSSTDYIDSELYYLDAVQVSNTSAQPTLSYTINVVEISQIEGFEWYLFDAGDKSYIEDVEFFGWVNKNGILTPVQEEVFVSEVEWHLETPDDNTITVQNYKTRFEDFFQRINATVQTVQYNEVSYSKINTVINSDGTINQGILLNSLNSIDQQYNLTSDGSVQINNDSILVQNLTNSANRVIINSEGIRVSSDGGETWRTAIDGQGINIGTVYTGSLNTNEVIIGSQDNPSFRWDKAGISAFKSNADNTYDLQTYVRYDQYGLYGIKDGGAFKAQELQEVLDKAHFAVTWDGFFIKNNYTNGRVEITSDNDFRVIKTVNNVDKERIKIGALEFNQQNEPTKYGIRIKNDDGVETFVTGDDGNIRITGTIDALGGNFKDIVTVGKNSVSSSQWIEINGINSSIYSSNYSTTSGWMIDANGNAVLNNITARGAIKTAVFEYAEIQAVGGVFLFRPSSTIRNVEHIVNTDNIKITVEKPYLFSLGDWCKISNYTDEMNEPHAIDVLSNNGLTHVYKIIAIDANNSRIITLEDAYSALTSGDVKVVNDISELIGGALVNLGKDVDSASYNNGRNNYGIGINSSDNTVNLPARAISLFETVIDETQDPKVSYNYRGILGTLPPMSTGVNSDVYQYMVNTQGIYTDNMYIGDRKQYIAFYTDENNNKQLRINAKQIIFEYNEDTGEEVTWEDHIDDEVDSVAPITVRIESSTGNIILSTDSTITLDCKVYKGNVDITSQVRSFSWVKRDKNGNIDPSWTPSSMSASITVSTSDIEAKAIFTCTVEF